MVRRKDQPRWCWHVEWAEPKSKIWVSTAAPDMSTRGAGTTSQHLTWFLISLGDDLLLIRGRRVYKFIFRRSSVGKSPLDQRGRELVNTERRFSSSRRRNVLTLCNCLRVSLVLSVIHLETCNIFFFFFWPVLPSYMLPLVLIISWIIGTTH